MSKKKELELEGKGGGNCVVWKRIGNLDLECNLKSVERQGLLRERLVVAAGAELYKEGNARQ